MKNFNPKEVKALVKSIALNQINKSGAPSDRIAKATQVLDKLTTNSDMSDFNMRLDQASRLLSNGIDNYTINTSTLMPPLFWAISQFVSANNGYTSPFSNVWRQGDEFGGDILEFYEGATTHEAIDTLPNSAFMDDYATERHYAVHRWNVYEVFGKTFFTQEVQRVSRGFNDLTAAVNAFSSRMFMDIEIFKNKVTQGVIEEAVSNGLVFSESITLPTDTASYATLLTDILSKVDSMYGYTLNFTTLNMLENNGSAVDGSISSIQVTTNTEEGRAERYGDVYVYVPAAIKNGMNVLLQSSFFNIPTQWFNLNFRSIPDNFNVGSGTKNTERPVIFICDKDWFRVYFKNGIGSEASNLWTNPVNFKTNHFIGVNGTSSFSPFAQAYAYTTPVK